MEKKDIELLRKLLLEADEKSNDTTQLFMRLWEILEYLGGNKTPAYNNRIEKEYKALKERSE